jgi:hypothetical protein
LSSQLTTLIELQTIDSELDQINLKRKELPEKKAVMDQELEQANQNLEAEKARLEEAIKFHRQKEDDLKKGLDGLKRTKERLHEVKTNKEYQAMLKEVENIEKLNGGSEDEIIRALEVLDRTRKEVQEKEKEQADFHKIFEKNTEQIDKELGAIDQDLENLQEKREKLQVLISPDLLKRYERIRTRRNGRAVVPVWKGICGGCNMSITPQMYIELQKRDDMMQCPYCSRIIYWDKNRNE